MLTKQKIQKLRVEMNAALAAVAKKHKISITCGSARFSTENATMKLDIAVIDHDTGEVITRERTLFMQSCTRYCLKPSDFGKTIDYDGREFTISGLAPRSRKYPILVKSAAGETYKISSTTALRLLGRPS